MPCSFSLGERGQNSRQKEAPIRYTFPIDVEFRTCEAGDLEALEWMGLHSRDRDIIHAVFAAQEAGDAHFIVGVSGGFPVAQAWIDLSDRGTQRRPYVWAIRVFPPLQGAGIGRALIAAVEEAATGADELELAVEPSNPGALRFYQRLGYVRCGVQQERAATGEVTELLTLRKSLAPMRRSAQG